MTHTQIVTSPAFIKAQKALKDALKNKPGPLLFSDTRAVMPAVVFHQLLMNGKKISMLVDRLNGNVLSQEGWRLAEVLRKRLNEGLEVTMVVRNSDRPGKDALEEIQWLRDTHPDTFKLFKASKDLKEATLTDPEHGGYFVFTVADDENYRQEHYHDSDTTEPEEVYNGLRDPEHARKLSVFFNTMLKDCVPW